MKKSISFTRKVGTKDGNAQEVVGKSPKKVLQRIRKAAAIGEICCMDEGLQAFVRAHRTDDVRELVLRSERWPGVDVRAAAVQIQGWQTARTKLPLWAETEGILFPEHLSMEQCSSQRTAEHKAAIAASLPGSGAMADLTGGFGVDATMMARRTGAGLTFIEPQPELCEIARHNLPLLGVEGAQVVCRCAEDALTKLSHQHLIYIDPSRRDSHGGKVSALSDCRPDVQQLLSLLMERADYVMVKLSPMLDLTQTLRALPAREAHVVSLEGECKELLLLMGGEPVEEPMIRCVCMGKGGTRSFFFTRSEEQVAVGPLAEELGPLLYEPDAAVMKAAPFALLGRRFGLSKLHPNSHLYTAAAVAEGFPGRVFRVEGSCAPTRRDVQAVLGSKPAAHLSVRNFPMSTDALRRKLGLKEGGSKHLFATTLRDGSHRIVVCENFSAS